MATIREVAKLAGVSPATVSRVMNKTAKVDDDKKNRVLEAIQQTGYQPNQLARALFKSICRLAQFFELRRPFDPGIIKSVYMQIYPSVLLLLR